jgi:hypothetical protein
VLQQDWFHFKAVREMQFCLQCEESPSQLK